MKGKSLVAMVLGLMLGCMGMAQWTEAADIKPEAPAIVTTCGQSPGALMVKLLFKRAKIECEQNDALTADDLKDGKYKTLIITTGTSLKGMGAAGTDIDAEVKRIQAVIAEATPVMPSTKRALPDRMVLETSTLPLDGGYWNSAFTKDQASEWSPISIDDDLENKKWEVQTTGLAIAIASSTLFCNPLVICNGTTQTSAREI